MTYHKRTKDKVSAPGNTLGVQLGRLAIRKKMPVVEIAKYTGASRSTIYSWFIGGGVSNAYKTSVTALIATLKKQ